MRVLFVNDVFPGCFQGLSAVLGADPKNEVIFAAGFARTGFAQSGVRRALLRKSRRQGPLTPEERANPLKILLNTTLNTARYGLDAFLEMRKTFVPDLIFATPRAGYALFVRDAFPNAYMVGYPGAYGQTSLLDVPDRQRLVRILTHDFFCSCQQIALFSERQYAALPPIFQPIARLVPPNVNCRFYNASRARFHVPGVPTDAPSSLARTTVTIRVDSLDSARRKWLWALASGLLREAPGHSVVLYSASVDVQMLMRAVRAELHLGNTPRLAVPTFRTTEDIRDLLCASDIYICLEKDGATPHTLLEAMASGAVPVLAADASVQDSHIAAVLADGYNAFFLPKARELQTFRVVSKLLRDPEKLAQVREQARATVQERFPEDEVIPRHVAAVLEDYQEWRRQRKLGEARREVARQVAEEQGRKPPATNRTPA